MKKHGYVYFVAAPGRIKIGYTQNPDDRLGKLRHADMEELVTLAIVPGTRETERTLHEKLSAHRIKGEWFSDCAAVRSEMDALVLLPPDIERHSEEVDETLPWHDLRETIVCITARRLPWSIQLLGMDFAIAKKTGARIPAAWEYAMFVSRAAKAAFVEFDRCRAHNDFASAEEIPSKLMKDCDARLDEMIAIAADETAFLFKGAQVNVVSANARV